MFKTLSKLAKPAFAKSVVSRAGVQTARAFSSAPAEGDVKFEFDRPFKGYNLDVPENYAYSNKEEMIAFFKQMAYFRRFEIVCDTLYKARQIRGFCHLYDGQEAVLVGMESVLTFKDSIITSYREHCHQLSRGDSGESVMGELLGKSIGCSRGKGGSMHLYKMENNFYGGNGIVGAQVPLGIGLAFAHKYRGDGGMAVAMYGDGAANQGQVYEAYNMAKMWDLPIAFVCENNEYAMGTSTSRHAADREFYKRGHYIPGIWVDGMDVLASRKAFQFVEEYCKSGKGPLVVEMSTYRYHGHSMSDPGISYRSRDEVDAVRRERDCIDLLKTRLIENDWCTAKEIKDMEKEIRKKVDKEVKAAKEAPTLPMDQLYEDIYYKETPSFVRAVDHANSQYFQSQNFYTG